MSPVTAPLLYTIAYRNRQLIACAPDGDQVELDTQIAAHRAASRGRDSGPVEIEIGVHLTARPRRGDDIVWTGDVPGAGAGFRQYAVRRPVPLAPVDALTRLFENAIRAGRRESFPRAVIHEIADYVAMRPDLTSDSARCLATRIQQLVAVPDATGAGNAPNPATLAAQLVTEVNFDDFQVSVARLRGGSFHLSSEANPNAVCATLLEVTELERHWNPDWDTLTTQSTEALLRAQYPREWTRLSRVQMRWDGAEPEVEIVLCDAAGKDVRTLCVVDAVVGELRAKLDERATHAEFSRHVAEHPPGGAAPPKTGNRLRTR